MSTERRVMKVDTSYTDGKELWRHTRRERRKEERRRRLQAERATPEQVFAARAPSVAVGDDGEVVRFDTREEFDGWLDAPSSQGYRVWLGRRHFMDNASREVREGITRGPGTSEDPWDRLVERAKTIRDLGIRPRRKRPGREDDMVAKKSASKKTASKKTAEKKTAAKRGRPSKREQLGQQIISVVAKENPKREGTRAFKQFSLYKDGMTVEDFIKAGGRPSALRYDTEKGFIKLRQPAAA